MALSKEIKQKLIKEFAINSQDTGSVEVQIALLTEDIRTLTDHCQRNNKDFSSKRGLLQKVCQRRSFLQYLERNDIVKYRDIIKRLELRK